jgi:predicted dehydrogenase
VAEPTVPIARFDRIVGTPDGTMGGGIAGTLREFLHALKTGARPPCECHDNIKSLAMVHAAIESAATGQRVAISV